MTRTAYRVLAVLVWIAIVILTPFNTLQFICAVIGACTIGYVTSKAIIKWIE